MSVLNCHLVVDRQCDYVRPFFVKGATMSSSDGRTEIALAPAERDQILSEMRELLKGVQGVVTGVNEQNAKGIEAAAQAVGMGMAARC